LAQNNPGNAVKAGGGGGQSGEKSATGKAAMFDSGKPSLAVNAN
jgi:hypothetical protein